LGAAWSAELVIGAAGDGGAFGSGLAASCGVGSAGTGDGAAVCGVLVTLAAAAGAGVARGGWSSAGVTGGCWTGTACVAGSAAVWVGEGGFSLAL